MTSSARCVYTFLMHAVRTQQLFACEQETPDAPEALLCMPSLQLTDIPREVSTIPTDMSTISDATLLTHDLFTNNVVYMEAAMDMRSLPAELLPLVPLFCRCEACRMFHTSACIGSGKSPPPRAALEGTELHALKGIS